MECPRCGEVVDAGAAYCGNCGVALAQTQPISAVPSATDPMPLPAYAVANPSQHKAESKSMVALILGILALPASIVPLLGWLLAITGIVMASIARAKMPRKTMNNVAIGFGSLAVLLSAGVFVFNVQQPKPSTAGRAGDGSELATTRGVAGIIDTPCYSVDVPGMDNVEHASGSCKAQAFNADTLLTSTNAFNVEGVYQEAINEANLAEAGQVIANNYLRTAMPDLVVASQSSGRFAGSPAYIIRGKSKGNVTIELALVLHTVPHGENVFVLAHAINDAQASLAQFEAGWEWK
jgi:hypothetical protein